MNVLLDTHTFLWMDTESRIGDAATNILAKADTRAYLSLASVWEMSIKISLGKLRTKGSLPDVLDRYLKAAIIVELPIRREHIIATATMPLHHRDPFDRLLVAQSMLENLPLISSDADLDRYGISRIWD